VLVALQMPFESAYKKGETGENSFQHYNLSRDKFFRQEIVTVSVFISGKFCNVIGYADI